MCNFENLLPALLSSLRDNDKRTKEQAGRCVFNLALNSSNHQSLSNSQPFLQTMVAELAAPEPSKSRDFCGRVLANLTTRKECCDQLISSNSGTLAKQIIEILSRLTQQDHDPNDTSLVLAALVILHISKRFEILEQTLMSMFDWRGPPKHSLDGLVSGQAHLRAES